MLNVDYKILATVLAKRLAAVLDSIISEDQTGFMSGRNIATTIRKTLDAIDLTDELNIPGYLICADYQKCFDLIEYGAIKGALEYFGMGPKYIALVDLLLQNFQSCVVNNGYMSPWFDVTRSCHQGCPLAPTLMICCAEVMALTLKQSPRISPLTIIDLRHLISQFADDTQLFSNNNPDSMRSIADTFETVRTNIGFTVNYEKTTITRLGNSQVLPLDQPFMWADTPPHPF